MFPTDDPKTVETVETCAGSHGSHAFTSRTDEKPCGTCTSNFAGLHIQFFCSRIQTWLAGPPFLEDLSRLSSEEKIVDGGFLS